MGTWHFLALHLCQPWSLRFLRRQMDWYAIVNVLQSINIRYMKHIHHAERAVMFTHLESDLLLSCGVLWAFSLVSSGYDYQNNLQQMISFACALFLVYNSIAWGQETGAARGSTVDDCTLTPSVCSIVGALHDPSHQSQGIQSRLGVRAWASNSENAHERERAREQDRARARICHCPRINQSRIFKKQRWPLSTVFTPSCVFLLAMRK